MRNYSKSLMALVIGSMVLVGAAGVASARGGCGGGEGGHGGGAHGMYGDAMKDLSPEVRDSIRKAHDALTPLAVQYKAKRAELSAKIYSGADDKTIQDLTKEVERLHGQLLEGRVGLQKQMAKAGLPMRGHGGMMGGGMMDGGMMDCAGMGGHGGKGGKGGHGDMNGKGGMSGHGGHGAAQPDAGATGAPVKGQK